MARAAEDPPSPVDAYAAYDGSVALPGAGAAPAPPAPRAASGELNDLAVIAFIAACIGFSIPAIVMGYMALAQIKRKGDTGHGFALGAVIIGWVVTVIVVLAVIAFVIFMIVVLSAAGTAADTYGDF